MAGSRFTLLGALLVGAIAGAFTTTIGQCGGTDGAAPPPAALSTPDLHSDVAVELSSAEVAALIQRSVEGGDAPLPLKHIKVGIGAGQIAVTGELPIPTGHVSSQIVLQPYVAGGQLRMRVTSAKLGPLPVPGDLPSLAEQPINDRLGSAFSDLHATPTSVTAVGDILRLTARLGSGGAAGQ